MGSNTVTQEKNYNLLLSERKFDPTAAAVVDKIYFSIMGNVIGTSGNFVTITGLPKSGKSTFIGAMIASFLSDKTIFDFKLHRYQDKFKLALFDTEQGNFDFQRRVKYIKKLSQFENIYTDFDAYLLRQDNSYDILRLIEAYIKTNKHCGIVIIDGLLDCIDNMNDEGASKKLIRLLKRWSAKYDILIIAILHLGKKDLSSIGHIGSACDRYAQSILSVEKTKEKTYVCSAKFLRSAQDFDNIEIHYDKPTDNYYKI